MDAVTLASAMGCSMGTANTYVADVNTALLRSNATTINRVAMWCAQIGHESAGLKYMEELASGAAYEGRRDLGNVFAGDGRRYKGRGPIQVTGRSHYLEFGTWCKAQGLVTDADYFINVPTAVATSRWGFLAAAWYWTVSRPQLNHLSDVADVEGATRAVNGGVNGLADRRARWNHCLPLGPALLPATPTPARLPAPKGLPLMIERALAKGLNEGRLVCPTGSASRLVGQSWVSVSLTGGGRVQMWCQRGARSDGAPPGSPGGVIDWTILNAERPWLAVPSGTEFIEYRITSNGGPGSLLIEQQPK